METNTLIVIAGISMTTLFLVLLFTTGKERKKTRDHRLKSLAQLHYGTNRILESKNSVRKKEQDTSGLLSFLNKVAPKKQEIERLLNQTGKDISLGKFIAIVIIVSSVVCLVLAGFIKFNLLTSILFSIAAGILGPLVVIKKMAEKRLELFVRDFPDAIDLMVRGMRSGLPVSESLISVSYEFDGPIGEEFKAVMDAVQFGSELEKALWAMAERLPSPDVKFFVITLSIQKDTGGNLADTLMNLSSILRSRKQMLLKIKALSSEAKASAMILGGLPFVLFGVMMFTSPDYVMMLFEDSRGQKMLVVGGVLILIGVMIMRKMVNFRI